MLDWPLFRVKKERTPVTRFNRKTIYVIYMHACIAAGTGSRAADPIAGAIITEHEHFLC